MPKYHAVTGLDGPYCLFSSCTLIPVILSPIHDVAHLREIVASGHASQAPTLSDSVRHISSPRVVPDTLSVRDSELPGTIFQETDSLHRSCSQFAECLSRRKQLSEVPRRHGYSHIVCTLFGVLHRVVSLSEDSGADQHRLLRTLNWNRPSWTSEVASISLHPAIINRTVCLQHRMS